MVAGSSALEVLTMTVSDSDSACGRRVARVGGATVAGLTATLIDVEATIDPAK
jgi:hypothetical protein